MKHVLTKEQTRTADTYAINELGISSGILMENAARSAFEYLRLTTDTSDRILILCGSGNNGGDGFALSRHLWVNDYRNLKVILLGSTEKMSPESFANYKTAHQIQIPIYENPEKGFFSDLVYESDVIIESLIGVGADEYLRGEIPKILAQINLSDAYKVAIDIPAGLNADTGNSHMNAFKADLTLTMFAAKLGMYLNSGPQLCGEIIVFNLGSPLLIPQDNNYMVHDNESVREYLGKRAIDTDKFDYGRIVVIAGSKSMPGAAALTANAAIKSGAGLVELLTTYVHPAVLPEIITYCLESNADGTLSISNEKFIIQRIEKADTVVIGPGIGANSGTIDMLADVIANSIGKKIIIDADGLRCVGKLKKMNNNIIITPHTYEFSRLIQLEPEQAKADLLNYSKEFASHNNCVLLVKSKPTIVTNGVNTFLNVAGNPGMATAGSGDVLTGIIAGLSYQIKDTLLNASIGAYLHSRAGDLYADEYDQITLTASSILEFLPKALKSVNHNILVK